MSRDENGRALVAATIAGRYGGLRPLSAPDASALYALFHDGHVATTWREMKVGPFPTEALFLAHVEELIADPSRAFFAVDEPTGAVKGWLCLMDAKLEHRLVEVGYILFAPTLQRTTLATEALYLVMRLVFDDLGFHRLEWTCTAENERSRSAADRLGFTYEGTMRERCVVKDSLRNICMYSMLSTEWPSYRAVLEAWLQPNNFAVGTQIESVHSIRQRLATEISPRSRFGV